MEFETCVWDVRAELRISEAKNLVSKKDGGSTDPFVVIAIDGEKVVRTSTRWRTLNPFFGESFYITLPHNFGLVDISIYNHDKREDHEKIGIVQFTRNDLLRNMIDQKERWFPVTKPTPAVDVHGEVFIQLLHTTTEKGLRELEVTVVKARDLFPKGYSGKVEPFVDVECDGVVEHSSPQKGSKFPLWDETFSFEGTTLPENVTIIVQDTNKINGSNFLGQVIIDTTTLEHGVLQPQWYRLRPRPQDVQDNSVGMGSIRMAIRLTHQLIMPTSSYAPLLNLLVEDLSRPECADSGVLGLFSELILEQNRAVELDRDNLASSLMRALKEDQAVECIKALTTEQIRRSEDNATLFRNNTLASKCADYFMKMIGLSYLHATVKEPIDDVFREHKDCEIDPTRMKVRSPALIKKHAADLTRYLSKILTCIFSSVKRCPVPMRKMFANIKNAVVENENLMAESADTGYTAVSGFLFLRFFAPAILSPNLFGIRTEIAGGSIARTLTLLAKAIQSIGNLGTTAVAQKEDYMLPLSQVMGENIPKVRRFIDELCDTKAIAEGGDMEETNTIADSLALSAKLFINENASKGFKKREIMLNKQFLLYQKTGRAGVLDGRIDLRYVTSVEKLSPTAYNKKRVVQVNGSSMKLAIQFSSKEEEEIWLKRFREYLRGCGAPVIAACHIGLFKKGRWTCCGAVDTDATPCSKTHTAVALDPLSSAFSRNEQQHSFYAVLVPLLPKLQQLVKEKDGSSWPFLAAASSLTEKLRLLELKHLLLQKPLESE